MYQIIITTDDYFEELEERAEETGVEGREREKRRERESLACTYVSRNLIYTTRKYRAILSNDRFSQCSYLGSLLYSHEAGGALVTPD